MISKYNFVMDTNRSKKKLFHRLELKQRSTIVFNQNKMRKLVQKSGEFSIEEKSFIKEHKWLYDKTAGNFQRRNLKRERKKEQEDTPEILSSQLDNLAFLFKHYKGRILVYTGAGISTSAAIPDYRGPSGKWTLSSKSPSNYRTNSFKFNMLEASFARPTLAHMAICKLADEGYIKYVVSQNVDGLHMRSGLSPELLSEIHGNIFVELCPKCEAPIIRNFDVTERTGQRRHATGRICPQCPNDGQLVDSIVHFGEKSKDLGESFLYKWQRIAQLLQQPHEEKIPFLILCLGTSLQVLKHYAVLWPHILKLQADQLLSGVTLPTASTLVIVNLQWTSKDKQATLKLHSSCDSVLSGLLSRLNLTADDYQPDQDPVKLLHVPIKADELNSKTRPDINFS